MAATFERALALAADRLETPGTETPQEIRDRSLAEHRGPLDLACSLNSKVVRTPALEVVSAALEHATVTPGDRVMISVPPQEGKTTLVRHAVIRALQHRPDSRNVIASYALDLARTSGRAIRGTVDQFGTEARDPGSTKTLPDRLGIKVAADHAAAADWSLRGHDGGLYCVGVGGGLTGRPIDGVLYVDDPVKGRAEAHSAAFQTATREWWQAVSETRLAPEASVVIVMTRWSEDDLVGWLLDSETADDWRVINIPALADGKTLDTLNREPGQWLISARRRTPAEWERKRQRVGEETFASLYQGRPAPVEGGVFKAGWFDMWRVDRLPAGCESPTVVVDPADNEGTGDEAGIVVGTRQPATGKVFVLDDLSGHMTVAQWARAALLACVRHNAPTLAYERSLSQLRKRIREAWETLHRQATALHKTGGDHAAALKRLTLVDDSAEVRDLIARQLAELADTYDAILAMGPAGPRVKELVAKGSKTHRMQLVSPLFETGRVVMVGRQPQIEHRLSTWQVGMDSPDRADSVVHLAALLSGVSGVASLATSKTERVPTSSTQLRSRSSNRLTRSTKR